MKQSSSLPGLCDVHEKTCDVGLTSVGIDVCVPSSVVEPSLRKRNGLMNFRGPLQPDYSTTVVGHKEETCIIN